MSSVMALLLVIRVFDRSPATSEERLAALKTAEVILQHAGLTPEWIDCSSGAPAHTAAACARPAAPNELTLRITPGPSEAPAERRTLGYSLVEPATGGGTLATVFSDRVAWLADAAAASRTVLLGRTIAHELGHLLIGTHEHAATGLMRAAWTRADLARDRREDWLFTPDDQARLRHSRIGAADPTRLAGNEPLAAGDS